MALSNRKGADTVLPAINIYKQEEPAKMLDSAQASCLMCQEHAPGAVVFQIIFFLHFCKRVLVDPLLCRHTPLK